MRLFSVVLGLTVFLALIYFSVLFWGLGRSRPHFDHSLSKLPKPMIFLGWDATAWTFGETKPIPWFEVYKSQDGTLRALPTRFRPQPQDILPKNFGNEGPPLKEAVQNYMKTAGADANSPMVFQIHSNVEGIQDQFAQEIAEFKLQKVVVQSEFDNIMSSVKHNKALWIFGTSASDRVRFMTFSSLALTPAVTFTGDVYYSPLKVRGIETMNARIVEEVKRRGLLLILGPLTSHDDVRQAKELGADGYFVDSLEVLSQLSSF